MQILSGKIIAQKIIEQIKAELCLPIFKKNPPRLAVILVGEDPASVLYVDKKVKQAEEIGVKIDVYRFSDLVKPAKVFELIERLNRSVKVHGIIVQLPLPRNFDRRKIIWAIDPQKDVDGFQMREFHPPAPQGIIELLSYYRIPIYNRKVTLVGYGILVGKPLSVLLKKRGADVTVCTSQTKNFEQSVRSAEIVICAAGKPKLITAGMVSKNQIVIDAGTSSEGGTTVGDVDFERVARKVKAISPVPGGVGPLTVAILFRNLVKAAKSQLIKRKR